MKKFLVKISADLEMEITAKEEKEVDEKVLAILERNLEITNGEVNIIECFEIGE